MTSPNGDHPCAEAELDWRQARVKRLAMNIQHAHAVEPKRRASRQPGREL
jgi:hypothetical protein